MNRVFFEILWNLDLHASKKNTSHFKPKNQRMLSRSLLNKIIILGFMVLVGWCLARGIHYRSVMGIILAITSLGAAVYFLYLLASLNEERHQQENA